MMVAIPDDFDENTKANIESWLASSIDEEDKRAIEKLIEEDKEEARKSFFTSLQFGTGGVRALMGLGSNRLNRYTIGQITQGFCNYLKKKFENPSIVIGFDSRKNSKEFATFAADVFSSNGIRAYLLDNLRPTPFISFLCRYLGANGAINITASHNQKDYNGYKVYGQDGAQLVSPDDTMVLEEVQKVSDFSNVKTSPNSSFIEVIHDELDDLYIEATKPYFFKLDQNKQKGAELTIIYSPLHGTGITLLPKMLENFGFTNLDLVESQSAIDSHFPGAPNPNPEEKEVLAPGVKQMVDENADLLLVTDPDADRIAVVAMHNNAPFFLNGNQSACIILDYILKNGKIPTNGAAIKTIVTTDLFAKICEDNKIKCFDLLTGFKYIGEKIREFEKTKEYQFIFGAEESYGCLIGPFARDKDAITAGAILCEMALDLKRQGKTLINSLFEIYHTHGFYEEKLHSLRFDPGPIGIEKMKTIMENLRTSKLTKIGETDIEIIEDYEKQVKITHGKEEPMSDLPKSNVLLFRLDQNKKLVIRPSGTEPKIKIYASMKIEEDLAIEELQRKANDHLNHLIDDFQKLCGH